MPLHGGHPFALALLDHLAIVEVLVDHTFGRPVEGITHQAGRVLRQGADAQPAGAASIEARDLRGADDTDEARCQPALRRHHALGRRLSSTMARVVATSSVRSK